MNERRSRWLAGLALVLCLCAGAVAWTHVFYRERETLCEVRLPDRGRVLVERRLLDSPLLPDAELQMRSGTAAGSEVFWRAALESTGRDLRVGPSTLVVRLEPVGAHVLRGYALDDGSLVWERDDAVAGDFDPILLEGGLYVERTVPEGLRAIDAATGEVRWQASLEVARAAGITAIETRSDRLRVLVAAARAVLDVDLASGAVTSLAPASAISACCTDAEVVWIEPTGALMTRSLEGSDDARRVGTLPAGTLECAREGPRVWISFTHHHVSVHLDEADPVEVETAPLAAVDVARDADGALFVLEGDALLWGRRYTGGGPSLGAYEWGFAAPEPWRGLGNGDREGVCYAQVRAGSPPAWQPRHPLDGERYEVESGPWLQGPHATFACATGDPIARVTE